MLLLEEFGMYDETPEMDQLDPEYEQPLEVPEIQDNRLEKPPFR